MVAVTGGSGRLGRAVLEELSRHGFTTTNFDQGPDGGLADQFVRGDILDGERVAAWMAGADALIHLAAIPAPGLASPDWLTQVNVMGTYRVLAAAAATGIRRVVLASSVSALGMAWGRRFLPRYLPIDERHPLWPEDEYGVSKQVNEVYARAFARRFDLTIAMLRFPTIVDHSTIARFKAQLQDHPEQAARLLWSYVDVADAARACRWALEADLKGAHCYYITAADHLAGEHVEGWLQEYFPGVPRKPDFKPTESLISSGAAGTALGYVPRVRWSDGKRPG